VPRAHTSSGAALPTPPCGTDAHDALGPLLHRRELLHRLAQDARPGRAEGVTERDTPAVRVDAIARHLAEIALDLRLVAQKRRALERLDLIEHLSGESLVDLQERCTLPNRGASLSTRRRKGRDPRVAGGSLAEAHERIAQLLFSQKGLVTVELPEVAEF